MRPNAGEAKQEPPFWQSKLHGEAFGRNFNQQQQKPLEQAVQVEIRPGVLHRVAVPQAGARPASAAAVAAAAPNTHHQQRRPPAGRRPGSAPSSRPPQQHQPQQSLDLLPELPEIEERMRQLLRAKAALHMKEKVVLLSAFAQVLGRPSAAAVAPADQVDVAQFVAAWQLLGLALDTSHAAAIFTKFGHDARMRLPVSVFTEALVAGGPRQLMLLDGAAVQQGPYKGPHSAKHTGKILYPQCKGGVWPPSNWEPALAQASSRLPEAQLELEWVYGFDRHRATSSNIAVNCQGHIVSFAAAVCITWDPSTSSQAFFRGHDDDICCIALAADRRLAASGQLGRDATVLVWDSVRLVQLAKLQHGPGSRGIQAVCFSSSGSKLATIATDNSHSISVWDWSKGIRLLELKTQPGAPPTVFGVVWSRFQPDRLVSFGQKHIKFWRLTREPSSRSSTGSGMSASVDSGVFGSGATHSVLCAAFLPSGTVLTGAPDGSICSWSGARCIRRTPAHAAGPVVSRPDGGCSHGGLSCLVLMEDGKTLISGAADGHVLKWDVSSGSLGACLQRLPLLTQQQEQQRVLDAAAGVSGPAPLPPAIRALDAVPGRTDVFVAGTAAGDVWQVDCTARLLLHGQQGEMRAVATNPRWPHVFATVSGGGSVAVWNAATHKPIRIFPVGAGMSGTALDFSADGQQLAVGLSSGGLKEFSFSPDTRQVWWCQAFGRQVTCVRYSPDGTRLAAAGHERVIDIFVRRSRQQQQPPGQADCPWVRAVRCTGHSAAVRHLDWSADGFCLQSMDQAYELLYFDASSGRQLKGSTRDTAWATYTCTLGFPVMGIWPPDSDGSDINSLDLSPCGDLLLTADDKGKVKLFNSPCVLEDAPGRCYGGHSSHVMCVRWAANGAYAISVGGNDQAVLQWRCSRGKEERRQQQQVVMRPLSASGVLWAPK